jgi:hypothetical protein
MRVFTVRLGTVYSLTQSKKKKAIIVRSAVARIRVKLGDW